MAKRPKLTLPLNSCFLVLRADDTLSAQGGFADSPIFVVYTRKSDAQRWIDINLAGNPNAPFRIVEVEIREAIR